MGSTGNLMLYIVVLLIGYIHLQKRGCYIELQGDARQLAQNMTCVVYDWENMTCSWDLKTVIHENNGGLGNGSGHLPDFNSDRYHVTLEWTVFRALSLCKRQEVHGSCLFCRFLHDDGRDSFILSPYFFHVNVTDIKTGIRKGKNVTIDTTLYVQPSQVTDVRVIPRTRKIKLSWSKDKPWYNTKFRVKYRPMGTVLGEWKETYYLQKEIIWTMERFKPAKYALTIKHLHPNTLYMFQVSSIPLIQKREKGFWSNYVEVTGQTLQDVPDGVPLIRPCFYSCNDTGCSTIRLYWQQIEKVKQNGELQLHRISVNGGILEIPGNKTSAVIRVQGSTETEVKITSRTHVGYSRIPEALLLVPAAVQRPPAPGNFIVEIYNSSSVFFTWDKLVDDVRGGNISYVIVWCQNAGSVKSNECWGQIQYKTLSSEVTEIMVEFPYSMTANDLFGIATEVENGKTVIGSGIEWTPCVYKHNHVPRTPLRFDIVMERMRSDTMLFRWKSYSCEESRGILRNYILSYCLLADTDCVDDTVIILDKSLTNFSVSGLEPGRYRSWIYGNFSGGLGPASDDVSFIIYPHHKPSDVSYWWTATIVVFITTGVLSFVYILYKIRECVQTKIPITVPPISSSIVEGKTHYDSMTTLPCTGDEGSENHLIKHHVKNKLNHQELDTLLITKPVNESDHEELDTLLKTKPVNESDHEELDTLLITKPVNKSDHEELDTLLITKPVIESDHEELDTLLKTKPVNKSDHEELETLLITRPVIESDHEELDTLLITKPVIESDHEELDTLLKTKPVNKSDHEELDTLLITKTIIESDHEELDTLLITKPVIESDHEELETLLKTRPAIESERDSSVGISHEAISSYMDLVFGSTINTDNDESVDSINDIGEQRSSKFNFLKCNILKDEYDANKDRCIVYKKTTDIPSKDKEKCITCIPSKDSCIICYKTNDLRNIEKDKITQFQDKRLIYTTCKTCFICSKIDDIGDMCNEKCSVCSTYSKTLSCNNVCNDVNVVSNSISSSDENAPSETCDVSSDNVEEYVKAVSSSSSDTSTKYNPNIDYIQQTSRDINGTEEKCRHDAGEYVCHGLLYRVRTNKCHDSDYPIEST